MGNQARGKGVSIHSEAFYTTLSSKNQITVPSKIREKINAKPGDQLVFVLNENDEVVVDVIKKNSLLSLFGSMPPKGETVKRDWSEIREMTKEELFTPEN